MVKIVWCAAAAVIMASAPALAQNLYGGYGSSGNHTYGTGSNPSSTYVQPYVRSDGTYVSGHHQTTPNSTQMDNYGSRGNYNPYTGAYGTRSPRY